MSGTSRTARLPFDHLLAELAAYPFASEAALSHPVTHLDPGMSRATAELWRAAERDLLAAAPGVSLDDLTAMRDDCWFGGERRSPQPLRVLLRRVTMRYLEDLGAGVGPRRPPPLSGPLAARPAHAQSRQSWMWLTFALPEDLLLAAVTLQGRVPQPDLLTPAVRDLLRRGFAETHLHVGASLDFRGVWSLLLARLASPGIPDDDLQAPGAVLREGRDLSAWLVRSAIARLVLSRFFGSGHAGPLAAYVHGPLFRGQVIEDWGVGTFSQIISALTDLMRGVLSDTPRSLLQDAYAALAGTRGTARVRNVASAWACDPAEVLLAPGTGSAEQRLVIRACDYLETQEETGRPDLPAATLFWQVVRVRTILYRHLTQRPLTPGLPWFIRFYGRMSQARGDVPQQLLVEAAATRSGREDGLSSLEMRTSPSDAMAPMRAWVCCAQEHLKGGGAELALVFHFLKIRGGEVASGVPKVGGCDTTADPAANACPYRYSGFYAEQRRAAMTLARLLHRWPRSLHLIRGLDVASDELAVPNWVFRPLVIHVRQAASSGARELVSRGERRPPPLRTTVHAGEDFSHLLTGLRHIDEAAEVLDLREGDRIGHGLALGIDPASWAARVGRVAMPLEERVFDLAWEWSWWTKRGRGADAGRLAFVAREVSELCERWLGTAVPPLDIENLGLDLADPGRLRDVGFPDGRDVTVADQGERWRLLRSYLCDQDVFSRGRKTVWVDPSGEIEALERICTSLRADIGRRGLAVEVNPTSNLLIGDLGDLESHPLWRMSSPVARASDTRLALTVGSDDPLVFNSSLPMEYQLLLDALVLAGLPDSEALTWLDHVRRTGLERRFTSLYDGDCFEVENLASLDAPLL